MSQTLHRFSARGVNSKPELARVVFLVYDTSSQYDLAICEVSWPYIPYGLGVMSRREDSITYMNVLQGEFIQKPNKPELSCLFTTYCLDMIQLCVNIHEYILYI